MQQMMRMTLRQTFFIGFMVAFGFLVLIAMIDPTQNNAQDETENKDENIDKNEIEESLAEILKTELLDGAITSVHVRKASDASVVFDHLGTMNLHPASNMKIITAAVALEVLGPEYEFSTDFLTDGSIENGILDGNLYIQGKGDPTLTAEDLIEIASQLKAEGIEKITGDVIADDSWYDDVRYSQDLNWSDEYNYTGSAISALSLSPNEDYDAGTVQIYVGGDRPIGEAPTITLKPENDYVKIENNATVASGSEVEGITIDREHGTNKIIIEGSINENQHVAFWRSVWEPTNYTLHVFNQILADEGVEMEGEAKVGSTNEDATVILTRNSPPLADLMIPFMKNSNNTLGEIFVKEMGKLIHDEGSWEQGLEVVHTTLEEAFELDMSQILLRDGSGMSHKTLVPADKLTKLLYEAQEKEWFPIFEASQPVAGEDAKEVGGTLAHRMKEEPLKGNVKAKTGSLTGVNTLSGFFTGASGEEYIFSVMINNYIEGYIPRVVDEIMLLLVEEL